MVEMGCCAFLCFPWPQFLYKYIVQFAEGIVYSHQAVLTTLRWLSLFIIVLFLESVRQVYYKSEVYLSGDMKAKFYDQAGKFRAERNMYLSGAVLLLSLVLNRLVVVMAESVRKETQLDGLTR